MITERLVGDERFIESPEYLDHDSYLPSIERIEDGKEHKENAMHRRKPIMILRRGSVGRAKQNLRTAGYFPAKSERRKVTLALPEVRFCVGDFAF